MLTDPELSFASMGEAPRVPLAEVPRVRLAEVLAALSMVTDLARGRPAEEAMRATLLAVHLGRGLGVADADLAAVYYATLLRFVGCTATSHEYAAAFGGDDVAARRAGDAIDPTLPREALSFLLTLARGPLPRRALQLLASAPSAARVTAQGARADCEVGARMARRFDLDPAVEAALYQAFERWDGRGAPRGLAGEAISLPARLAAVAHVGVMFFDAGGPEAAVQAVRRWSGRALDPGSAAAFASGGAGFLEATAEGDAWDLTVQAEPGVVEMVTERRLDELALGFADAVDLKSPHLHGHSSGVAALAEAAAVELGMGAGEVADVRRAALLHDLGRAGVPTGIWERPGALSTADREAVRLHPYHTERILSRAPGLVPLARIASMHHERLDGSGYHRGAPAAMQGQAARVLAAADVLHALTEPRPHRPAFGLEEAAGLLERQPLDRDAVAAVLAAAGRPPARRRSGHPAGLTEREIEVLRLLVVGRSEKQIARELFISPATVHTHVAHIYAKAGVSTRAAAAMFAMEHDLVRP